jgi:DNA invertase Pin-like site-specific DNA recombinase
MEIDMLVGYARTSTTEQVAGLEAQERDLKAAGVERVFREQVSSVAVRDALKAALAYLRDGDALVVTKPDRLARSTQELLTIHADLEKRGVGLVVLSMGLDTRNGCNPTAKLTLTVLAGVAEWERQMMLERQREGIAKAKAEGKYKGRAPTVARQGDEIRRRLAAGEKPARLARELGVARSSIYRMKDEMEQNADLTGGASCAGCWPGWRESVGLFCVRAKMKPFLILIRQLLPVTPRSRWTQAEGRFRRHPAVGA